MSKALNRIRPMVAGERGADRGIIAGRSGSGKSVLAKELLRGYGPSRPAEYRCNVLVIDPNHTFDYPADVLAESPEGVHFSRKNGTVLLRPDPEAGLSEAQLNTLFGRLFLGRFPAENLLVYVDELYALESLFRTSQRFGADRNWLRAYLTQGRARGRAFLASVQRPANVPRDVFAQAEWFYMFDLPLEDDRKTMAGMMGRFSSEKGKGAEDLVMRSSLGRYEFWFRGPEEDYPKRLKLQL